MTRVCGATAERTARDRRACWCGGLFCGPGGGRESQAFFRHFHTTKTARSLGEFADLVMQADLFDGNALRDRWRDRIDAMRATAASYAARDRASSGRGKVLPMKTRGRVSA